MKSREALPRQLCGDRGNEPLAAGGGWIGVLTADSERLGRAAGSRRGAEREAERGRRAVAPLGRQGAPCAGKDGPRRPATRGEGAGPGAESMWAP